MITKKTSHINKTKQPIQPIHPIQTKKTKKTKKSLLIEFIKKI